MESVIYKRRGQRDGSGIVLSDPATVLGHSQVFNSNSRISDTSGLCGPLNVHAQTQTQTSSYTHISKNKINLK